MTVVDRIGYDYVCGEKDDIAPNLLLIAYNSQYEIYTNMVYDICIYNNKYIILKLINIHAYEISRRQLWNMYDWLNIGYISLILSYC